MKFAMSKTVGPALDAGCARLALPSRGAVARNEEASEIARRRLRGFMERLLFTIAPSRSRRHARPSHMNRHGTRGSSPRFDIARFGCWCAHRLDRRAQRGLEGKGVIPVLGAVIICLVFVGWVVFR